MKIICAGSIKTGTKSLHAALAILGYKVYDFQDHFYYLHDEWFKVFEGKATVEDFRRMYKDIDAGIDEPFFHYWREILDAFPNAKIILTVRENENNWSKSQEKQTLKIKRNKFFCVLLKFSPLGWKWKRFYDELSRILYGDKPYNFFDYFVDKPRYLSFYRRHNAYVKQVTLLEISKVPQTVILIPFQCAPKDQLLVFNCKEGWKPLCKFLDVPMPENIPFPHKNAKADIIDELMKENPLFVELQNQTKITFLIITLITASVIYLLLS